MGQNPEAADSLGVNVNRVRYFGVIFGAAMAGVAGATLSTGLLCVWQENITNGIGFIAVALVYFGGWRPLGVLFGSLLFATVNAFQLWVQVKGIADSLRPGGHAALRADDHRAGLRLWPSSPAGCADQTVRAQRLITCRFVLRTALVLYSSISILRRDTMHRSVPTLFVLLAHRRFGVDRLRRRRPASARRGRHRSSRCGRSCAAEAPRRRPPAAKPFKIAFVLPSSVTDLAWGQAMYDALKAVQAEMGEENLEIAYSDNMFQVADAAAAIRDYASPRAMT